MSIYASRGFTLVELIIIISIVAILAAIAIPSFQKDLVQREIQNTQVKLRLAIQMARQQAMSQTDHVVICSTNNAKSCINDSWSSGFLVFNDRNNNRQLDGDEVVLLVEKLNLKYGSLKLRSLNPNNLSFMPRTGLPLGSNGTFSYCATDTQFSYSLVMSQMGHSRIDQTQKCS